jgi:hypothetical protein
LPPCPWWKCTWRAGGNTAALTGTLGARSCCTRSNRAASIVRGKGQEWGGGAGVGTRWHACAGARQGQNGPWDASPDVGSASGSHDQALQGAHIGHPNHHLRFPLTIMYALGRLLSPSHGRPPPFPPRPPRPPRSPSSSARRGPAACVTPIDLTEAAAAAANSAAKAVSTGGAAGQRCVRRRWPGARRAAAWLFSDLWPAYRPPRIGQVINDNFNAIYDSPRARTAIIAATVSSVARQDELYGEEGNEVSSS